jgi:hypothetical protein
MMESPYDGLPRRSLRIGLSAIAGVTLLTQALSSHFARPGPGAHATTLPLQLVQQDAVAVPLTLAGLAALVLFARKPAQILPGAVALAIMTILSESHTALTGSTSHFQFAPAATLLGWLCGLVYAWCLERRRASAAEAPRVDGEALAEAGAVAVLAATYVNAGASKLLQSGVAWADGATLDAAILSLHRVDDGSALGAYARWLVEHPGASRAFGAASLIIEAGAFLYVARPWLRMLWGALILSFHVNVALLLGIPYVLSWATVLLFSFPWPRIARRRADQPVPALPP